MQYRVVTVGIFDIPGKERESGQFRRPARLDEWTGLEESEQNAYNFESGSAAFRHSIENAGFRSIVSPAYHCEWIDSHHIHERSD